MLEKRLERQLHLCAAVRSSRLSTLGSFPPPAREGTQNAGLTFINMMGLHARLDLNALVYCAGFISA
jgi:hypothetical protein